MTTLESLATSHAGRVGHVLGNGRSRLETWSAGSFGDDLVIGCNAAHRDVKIDYCVAVDDRMIEEVAGWNGKVITLAASWNRLIQDRPHQCQPLFVSGIALPCAGAYAFYAAIILGCNPIYLWGMDGDDKTVYDGTHGYEDGRVLLADWPLYEKAFRDLKHRWPRNVHVVVMNDGKSYLDRVFPTWTVSVIDDEETCLTELTRPK